MSVSPPALGVLSTTRRILQTTPVHFQTILEQSDGEELDRTELSEIFEIDRLRASDPTHCADAHQVEVSFR